MYYFNAYRNKDIPCYNNIENPIRGVYLNYSF